MLFQTSPRTLLYQNPGFLFSCNVLTQLKSVPDRHFLYLKLEKLCINLTCGLQRVLQHRKAL